MRRFILSAVIATAVVGAGCKTSTGQKEEAVRVTARQGLQHKLALPGYSVFDADDEGRLWIFRADAKELAEFSKSKEIAKFVSLVGEGPNGVTIKGPDLETLNDYMKAYASK